jgi:hypothetical protein
MGKYASLYYESWFRMILERKFTKIKMSKEIIDLGKW